MKRLVQVFCLMMAVPALAVSAGFAAADKAAKVEDAGKDAEKPFSPLDNCGDDLWQPSCDCPEGYLMTPWESLQNDSRNFIPDDIGTCGSRGGCRTGRTTGTSPTSGCCPTGEGWMILKLARPLTVKIGNKTVKRGPYLAMQYPYIYSEGAGFYCSMAIETCADEGEVETLFDEIDGRTDCEKYSFSIGRDPRG